ncbi:MAG TPA: hypothetical protein VGJ31_15565 [Dongiaceae bacterium]
MGITTRSRFAAVLAILCVLALSTGRANAQEQPVAPEANPPGDIPDSQAFVPYTSPLGFAFSVPEGWARTDRAAGAHFADKYDDLDISIASAPTASTLQSVRASDVAALKKTGRAVEIVGVKSVTLPAGKAALISCKSNSAPNQVTGKQIRLENDRYLFFKAGKMATLDMSAPAGADNVDQWKLMAESFRWQ